MKRSCFRSRHSAEHLEAAKVDVQDLGRKSVDYNVLEREASNQHGLRHAPPTGKAELRVSSSSRTNNARIIDRAEVPKAPMRPTGRRTWLMALSIGFSLCGRGRARSRLHERHGQDPGGRGTSARSLLPRPCPYGSWRQVAAAGVDQRAG